MRNLNPVDIIAFESGYSFEYRQIVTGLIVAILTFLPLIFLWTDHRMTPVIAQIFIMIFSLLLGLFSLYLLLNIKKLTLNLREQKIIYTSGLIIKPYQLELPFTALKRLVLNNLKSGENAENGYLKWNLSFEIEGLELFDFYEVNSNDSEAVYAIAIKWAELFHIEVDNRIDWEIEEGKFVKA